MINDVAAVIPIDKEEIEEGLVNPRPALDSLTWDKEIVVLWQER